jgi:hypothetical protein
VGTQARDLNCNHLAGASGKHGQIESGLRICLFDAPRQMVRAPENTAVRMQPFPATIIYTQ